MTRPHTPNKVYDTTTVDLLAAGAFCFLLGFMLAAMLWSAP